MAEPVEAFDHAAYNKKQRKGPAYDGPENPNAVVESLALLGCLTPDTMPSDIVLLSVFMCGYVEPLPGDGHPNDRELAAVKAMTKAQRIEIRDKILGVIPFRRPTPVADNNTNEENDEE